MIGSLMSEDSFSLVNANLVHTIIEHQSSELIRSEARVINQFSNSKLIVYFPYEIYNNR